MNRDKKQEELLKKYIRDMPLRSTIVASTGFGKSKLAIDLITAVLPDSVIIFANSTNIRDITWKDEFEKWGYGDWFNEHVKTYTYQAANRWEKSKLDPDDFIIFDEVDFIAATKEYSKIMLFLHASNRVLGLTGFITKDKQWWFNLNLPLFYEYSGNDAREDGVINDIHYVFVRYEIGSERNRVVKYMKAGTEAFFKASENSQYDFQHQRWETLNFEKIQAETNPALSGNDRRNTLNELHNRMFYAKKEMTKILNSMKSSADLAKKLANEYAARGFKVVTFSERTENADLISNLTYHGGNTDRINTNHMNKFVDSTDDNILSVCGKINRGSNIPNLKVGVFESYNSSDTVFQQRIGRLSRLDSKNKAIAVILLPYFYEYNSITKTNKLKETIAVKWARQMMKGLEITSHEFINKLNNEIDEH